MANNSSGNSSGSCITTTTVIRNCINPLEKFLNSIISGIAIDSLERILDKGVIMPDCHCCPCPEDEPNLYYIGSVERFLLLNESYGGFNNITCCSTFNETIYEMKCYLEGGPVKSQFLINGENEWDTAFDFLLHIGLIEFGLINGESQLSIILNWYKSNIEFLTKNKISLFQVLEPILTKGLVLSCNQLNAGSILASVETYFKAVELVNPVQAGAVSQTCCINIFGGLSVSSSVINALNNGSV